MINRRVREGRGDQRSNLPFLTPNPLSKNGEGASVASSPYLGKGSGNGEDCWSFLRDRLSRVPRGTVPPFNPRNDILSVLSDLCGECLL
jgi:hypothetical protein